MGLKTCWAKTLSRYGSKDYFLNGQLADFSVFQIKSPIQSRFDLGHHIQPEVKLVLTRIALLTMSTFVPSAVELIHQYLHRIKNQEMSPTPLILEYHSPTRDLRTWLWYVSFRLPAVSVLKRKTGRLATRQRRG